MCGIVGFIGEQSKAVKVVLDGLTALEYRGYDSAGIAFAQDGHLVVDKQVGRVQALRDSLGGDKQSDAAIGHTRWATHGGVTAQNAHPHTNAAKTIAVVHNGIIENYVELREHLQKQGYELASQTDTEVVPHLIDFYRRTSANFEEAFEQALDQLRGAYALGVMTSEEPDVLYAARLSSPLVLGVESGLCVIASDPSAIMEHTRQVVFLNDYEYVRAERNGNYSIKDFKNAVPVNREAEVLDYDADVASKGDYPHFMLKEMFEIPAAVRSAVLGRVKVGSNTVKLGGLESVAEQLKYIDRIVVVACGTASYAGLYGEYAIEELADIPVEVQQASEFKYRSEPFSRSTALIAVSQSGETADTIAALKKVENYGVLRLGVVNAIGSTIARMTDAGVYCHAGPEQAVASTKAFFSQAIILMLIGLYLSNGRSPLYKPLLKELDTLPDKIKQVLDNSEQIKALAEKYKDYRDYFFLGRGYGFPAALEGTLKLKECALVHAEAYPAGEMKHGPLALIDETFPIFVVATDSVLLEKTMSNIQEARARGGPVIAVATEGNEAIKALADDVIFVPKSMEQTAPLLAVAAMQLFAYYVAIAKGYDVDRPRNLAKSVTVE
ncbi:MAG TPA: glutamine--fructose-6-phosphate transaminase (isomerizing) [Candidatus Saccharimonadales bacterium]|nr:glutamine--fructose-6-phosphate transaminase (isomerizing) [Candidatus Saccharimonadales bacterium]